MAAADFTAALTAECEGDTGQALLADALEAVVGSDGSNRIVEILRTCNVQFVGAVDQALGRPTTNVEALIDNPENNVTPNQTQLDLLNAELAVYWRIAEAWAQSQQAATGATTTTVAGAATTAPGSSVPGSDVSTSTAEASSTTAG